MNDLKKLIRTGDLILFDSDNTGIFNLLDKGIKLPESYEGYSFHSFETLPLSTDSLTAEEIITLRDEAFTKYLTHKPFLKLIEKKFGKIAADNILQMTKIKLKRRIKGDKL